MLPPQKIPYKKKIADDYQWAKDTVDAICSTLNRTTQEQQLLNSLYGLYFSKINQQDFERDCNPLGITLSSPDEIKPYNLVHTKVEVLIGEKLSRPYSYKVITVDRNSVSSRLEKKKELLLQFLLSLSDKDPLQIEGIMNNYRDHIEILSSKILDYLHKYLDLKEVSTEGFRHALISGYEVYRLNLEDDSPSIEVIHPSDFFFPSTLSTHIEDSPYALYRTYRPLSYVLDKYDLKEEEKEDLQNMYSYPSRLDESFSAPPYQGNSDILVEEVEWVSFREVFFVDIDSPTSKSSEIFTAFDIPPSSAKVKKDGMTYYSFSIMDTQYTVTKKWIKEIWRGTRIARKYYVNLGIRPYSISLKNSLDEKLSFFGAIYSFSSHKPVSLVERMKPFQYLYLVTMHKLKKLIAQDFGRVFPLDISMIDPKIGLEKTLYYLRELSLDIYNPLQNAEQPGWAQRGKVTSAIDLSNASHIFNYIRLLEAIELNIGLVAGINRQREGLIAPQESVTNAHTNIQISSLVTLSSFYIHDRLWERVLTALINLAKQSSSPLYTRVVLSDTEVSTLAISNLDELALSELGVFVTSSAQDLQIFESLRASAQVLFNSKQVSPLDYISIMSASSISEIKQIMMRLEQKEAEMRDQNIQLAMQKEALDREHEINKEKIRAEALIQTAIIKASDTPVSSVTDANKNYINDALEVEMQRYDQKYREDKLDLERKKLELLEKKLEDES